MHLGAGWAFYKQPLFLRPYFGSLLKKTSSIVVPLEDEDINLSEKNISLEDVMSHIIEIPMQEQHYLSQNDTRPSFEKTSDSLISSSTLIDTPDKLLVEDALIATTEIPIPQNLFEEEFVLPEVPLSFLSKLEPSKELTSDYVPHVEVPSQKEVEGLFPKQDLETTLNIHTSLLAENAPLIEIPQELDLPNIFSLEEDTLKGSSISATEFLIQAPEFPASLAIPSPTSQDRTPPSIPHLKTPSQSNHTLALDSIGTPWDAGFDVEVTTMPREEGGYFFSVTLLPKYDMSRKQMNQNYTFLIDRTNSIGKHRYQTFKKAVARALASLEEGSRFNIVVFDKKVISLSEKPLTYSKKSLQMAQAFLEKQEHGSYFSAADLCKSLPKIIPNNTPENEVSSVILITDGDSSVNEEKQRKIIQSFLQKNKGKFSLYTAAVGERNNLAFLELLSSVNNGSLLYSDTHASFPRKLTKLVLDLLHPIAKDVAISISQSTPKNHIKLHSTTASLPCLFSKRPYTIYGTADTLSDFTLVLQGKNKDELFTIRKNISFTGAKKDARSLSKKLAQTQAHTVYEDYLKTGEIALLEQAKTLLDGPVKSR